MIFGDRSGNHARERLIEETISAWRPRTPDGRLLAHPAWADLPVDDRVRAYDEMVRARALESLIDGKGLSTTAKAVLRRIGGIPR